MGSWLWALVPDEMLILLVLGIAAAVMFGFLRGKIWITLLGLVILPVLVAPFFESLFSSLPVWVSLAALAVFGLVMARALLELFIGRRAADHVVGALATKCILGVGRSLVWPFRLLGNLFRSGTGLR